METLDRFPCARECNYCAISRALKIIKMAQLCLLCKCEAAKKTRRRLSESLLPALRAVHCVAWPDRGETADDP